MLYGELLNPQWSCKIVRQEAGQCVEKEVTGSEVGSRALMGVCRVLLCRWEEKLVLGEKCFVAWWPRPLTSASFACTFGQIFFSRSCSLLLYTATSPRFVSLTQNCKDKSLLSFLRLVCLKRLGFPYWKIKTEMISPGISYLLIRC